MHDTVKTKYQVRKPLQWVVVFEMHVNTSIMPRQSIGYINCVVSFDVKSHRNLAHSRSYES